MTTNYRKHLASARRLALEDGVPDDIVDSRLGNFESLLEANPRIAQQLDEVGLLASACNRIALGAKFDRIELDRRLAGDGDSYQQGVDSKLCLLNIGLID